jgi:hypothetical protein
MAPTARRARTDWAATRVASLCGLVFRMLWSLAAGFLFFFLLFTWPLELLRKAALLSNDGVSSRFFNAHHTWSRRRLRCLSLLGTARDVVPHRTTQRARRGMAPDGGVQGSARGGEGVAAETAEARGVRWT